MERRNRSIKALDELKFISYLEEDEKAQRLILWANKYLEKGNINDFDLELKDLESLSELFYSNLEFLNIKKDKTKDELDQSKKLKKFMLNS
ncbi:MAG: hypothetical protein MJK08_13225 [Campylobacterales bacterium]|nr:hypothetical protein [Campylobacterales bacterium]NQY53462.1 hypothetical protein [Campylobacteraceae bacterium]